MYTYTDILTEVGIGVFCLLISGYIIGWYLKKEHVFEDIITNGIINVINDAQNDEGLQKNLYTVGALLGNGIAQGSGMKNTVRGGGKFNLNNLIAEIASNFIQKAQNTPQNNPIPQQIQNTETLNTEKTRSSRW